MQEANQGKLWEKAAVARRGTALAQKNIGEKTNSMQGGCMWYRAAKGETERQEKKNLEESGALKPLE